jgi:hypothetical protein
VWTTRFSQEGGPMDLKMNRWSEKLPGQHDQSCGPLTPMSPRPSAHAYTQPDHSRFKHLMGTGVLKAVRPASVTR